MHLGIADLVCSFSEQVFNYMVLAEHRYVNMEPLQTAREGVGLLHSLKAHEKLGWTNRPQQLIELSGSVP